MRLGDDLVDSFCVFYLTRLPFPFSVYFDSDRDSSDSILPSQVPSSKLNMPNLPTELFIDEQLTPPWPLFQYFPLD
ncbi:hypothetical protein ACFX19_002199 [Malus domestica]